MDINSFPTPPNQQESQQPYSGLGASFNNLIGNNVEVIAGVPVVTETQPVKKRRSTKKKEELEPIDSKNIVENTVYADTYQDTNNMAFSVIQQADVLLNDAKAELDHIRISKTMKGKYTYMTNMLSAMSNLMGTKMQAIREINSNIKNANDMEYRRFKDNRAINAEDDNKAIMDAYKAYISAPIGAPSYSQPTVMDITAGLNGVIPAGLSTEAQQNFDRGLNNYLNNLSPEDNYMLNESNPDIEEVIVFDQATGMKYFQWRNMKTGQPVPNMPKTSNILMEDYVIDPRTRLAKNNNLNKTLKVVYDNEGKFNEY